jgi:hypothetical protein
MNFLRNENKRLIHEQVETTEEKLLNEFMKKAEMVQVVADAERTTSKVSNKLSDT